MTEIIMELSEEELPDYVNALLDQNRELRERVDNLEREREAILAFLSPPVPSTITDYVEKYHGGAL